MISPLLGINVDALVKSLSMAKEKGTCFAAYMGLFTTPSTSVFYIGIHAPQAINIAETPKIIGHNLKGRKAILNPVNNETMASTINVHIAHWSASNS